MLFKPLPPGLAAAMIKDAVDELTPQVEQSRRALTTTPCPRCGGALKARQHESFMFTIDQALPRVVHSCEDCGYTVDPATNLVLKTGNPAAVKDPFRVESDPSG